MSAEAYATPYTIELLVEAIKPFAGIVGMDSAPATITIGNDSWSHPLTGKDFSNLRRAYMIAKGFIE